VDVIVKAIQDERYREVLFANPDLALEGYELKEEEVRSLKELELNTFKKAVDEIEAELLLRIQKGDLGSEGLRAKTLDYPVVEEWG
jgi:hypothetical protein